MSRAIAPVVWRIEVLDHSPEGYKLKSTYLHYLTSDARPIQFHENGIRSDIEG
jgi:hypothetical protein